MPASQKQSLLAPHFPPEVAARLEQALSVPGALWVTDADGTLWSDDIGEGFLQKLIADNALVSPEAQGIDVWLEYEARVAADKGAGYAWAAQVMAGMPEAEVRERAASFAKAFVPRHLYGAMAALIEAAQTIGAVPWIVSASNQWIVEAAAPLLGMPANRVAGIRVAVANGRLTSRLVSPVTFKAGKVDTIQQLIGRTPTLVSGDSSGDVEMLAVATSAALFVAHPGKTSADLLKLAGTSGWLTVDLPGSIL